MQDSQPAAFASLPPEIGALLRQHAISFAQHLIARLFWRGSLAGVVAQGFDPESIAHQAIHETLKTFAPQTPSSPENLELLARQVRRRVRQHVDRLNHLQENKLTRNEPDLALTPNEDGVPVSPIEIIPDPSPPPDQSLLLKEEQEEQNRFHVEFRAFLAKDRRLTTLLDQLLDDDVAKPQDLARKFKARIRSMTYLKQRLGRCLIRFRALKSSAKNEISVKKT